MSLFGSILGGIVGGAGSYLGAKEAADAQKYSADIQKQMYDQTRSDLGPYREFGQQALNPLFDTAMNAAAFDENHPAYKAIMKSRAAQGALGSGGTLTALSDYWSTVYQPQRFNQLYDIAGMGQNAAAQTGVAGASAARGIGQAVGQAGAYMGMGYAGVGQAISDAIGNYYYLKGK